MMTESMDKTLKVDSDINSDDTVHKNDIADTTVRNDSRQSGFVPTVSSDFILKGRKYVKIACLSNNTGEAQVYLVENDSEVSVLKIYYPNISINKTIQKIILNMNFEMIVKIKDFGKTFVNGVSRDYELMEYLKGGTLKDYKNINADSFRRIAFQCASALKFCHNNKILHKDIKPGNFFFRDEGKTEVVLGDFGISSVLKGDRLQTTQSRTPVYAAPEMYVDVIDGQVELTPAADFYSLGMTLLSLWLDHNALTANERLLMKSKNEGRLPGINELPARVKLLIQGLTVVNPAKRWGYEEVERWFLGESPSVDLASPFLRYRSFIVDPERNIVADNVEELVPLLLANERVACGYLYSGKITEWLEQCGNLKLSVAINDIVTNRYPANQSAGLMAAAYTMVPSYPYTDIKGNRCDDIHNVALSLLTYIDEYAVALQNKFDNLWLYIESHADCDMDRLQSYFKNIEKDKPHVPVLKLVYEIDREIPFLSGVPSSTAKEIAKSFGQYDLKEDDWVSLTDGRLMAWMHSHEDNMACESLKIITDNEKYSKQLAYKVLYTIDREAPFDLVDADTPDKIGSLLVKQLCAWQNTDEDTFNRLISDYSCPNGRFAYYAQQHGWYNIADEVSVCFDMQNPANKERLSAYNLRTAAYRCCIILGERPVYQLDNGTALADGRNLSSDIIAEISKDKQNNSFCQWLSVFYHEDPNADFTAEYSYEKCLEEWLLTVGSIYPQNKYFKRYKKAKSDIQNHREELKSSLAKVKIKKILARSVFWVVFALWIMSLLTFGITGHEFILHHPFLSIVLPVGGFTGAFLFSRFYFKSYGILVCLFMALLGMLTAFIPVVILKSAVKISPDLFQPIVFALSLVYALICHFTDYRKKYQGDYNSVTDFLESDKQSMFIEPLCYTFKTKAYNFKGSNYAVYDDMHNQLKSVSSESIAHYAIWSLMFLVLLIEMILFNPKLSNLSNPDLDRWESDSINIVDKSMFEKNN